MPKLDNKKRLLQPLKQVPAGAKLLRSEAKGGGWLCVCGILRTMEQFVEASRALSHPFDTFLQVPDRLLICIFEILVMGPLDPDSFADFAGVESS